MKWRGYCHAFLKRGQQGQKCRFIAESQRIAWFFKINLKQIYCSYSRTHKIQNGFLQFLLSFLRQKILLLKTSTVGNDFCFLQVSIALHSFPSPCPSAVPASLFTRNTKHGFNSWKWSNLAWTFSSRLTIYFSNLALCGLELPLREKHSFSLGKWKNAFDNMCL